MKYLERLKEDIVEIKKHLQEVRDKRKISKQNLKKNNLGYTEPRYNLYSFLTNCINNNKIGYGITNFVKSINKFYARTDLLKDISFDLVKIENCVNNKEISENTFTYIILRFYASHYDIIIQFLEPLAKKIKSGYNLNIYRKNGKIIKYISDAESIEKVFEKYDKKFYDYLMRFCDRDLRNSIAHEDYKLKERRIIYKKKHIIRDTIFKKITSMGLFINRIQEINAMYNKKITSMAINKKLSKKKLKIILKTYTL